MWGTRLFKRFGESCGRCTSRFGIAIEFHLDYTPYDKWMSLMCGATQHVRPALCKSTWLYHLRFYLLKHEGDCNCIANCAF